MSDTARLYEANVTGGRAPAPPVDLSGLKFEPEPIGLDAFTVEAHGRTYHPHAGEYVWSIPYGTSLPDTAGLVALRAGFNENDDAKLERGSAAVIHLVSSAIVAHTLTDARGEPYPQPLEDPEWAGALDARLLMFLFQRIQGQETEGEG